MKFQECMHSRHGVMSYTCNEAINVHYWTNGFGHILILRALTPPIVPILPCFTKGHYEGSLFFFICMPQNLTCCLDVFLTPTILLIDRWMNLYMNASQVKLQYDTVVMYYVACAPSSSDCSLPSPSPPKKKLFSFKMCVCWESQPSKGKTYSETLDVTLTFGDGPLLARW